MSKYDWGQFLSGVFVAIGVSIEIAYGAHIGFVFITAGALSWGIFTKLKGK